MMKLMEAKPEQIKTVEDFEKVTKPPLPKEPPIWPTMILCILFPPIGLFYAWKKKILQYILPLYVSFASILFIFSTLSMISTTKPLDLISESLGIKNLYSSSILQAIMLLSLILGTVGAVLGLYYRYKVKMTGKISRKITQLLLGVLLMELFFFIGQLLLVINYIYSNFYGAPPREF